MPGRSEQPEDGFRNQMPFDEKALREHGLLPSPDERAIAGASDAHEGTGKDTKDPEVSSPDSDLTKEDKKTPTPRRRKGRSKDAEGGVEPIEKGGKIGSEEASGAVAGKKEKRAKKKKDSKGTPSEPPTAPAATSVPPQVEPAASLSIEYRWDYKDLREKIFSTVEDANQRRELLNTLDRIDPDTPLRDQVRATVERGIEYAKTHESVWDPFSKNQSAFKNLEALANLAGIPAEEVEKVRNEVLKEKQIDPEAFKKERKIRQKKEHDPGAVHADKGRLLDDLGFALAEYFTSIRDNASRGKAEPSHEVRKKIRTMRQHLLLAGVPEEELDQFWDKRAEEEHFDWSEERKRAYELRSRGKGNADDISQESAEERRSREWDEGVENAMREVKVGGDPVFRNEKSEDQIAFEQAKRSLGELASREAAQRKEKRSREKRKDTKNMSHIGETVPESAVKNPEGSDIDKELDEELRRQAADEIKAEGDRAWKESGKGFDPKNYLEGYADRAAEIKKGEKSKSELEADRDIEEAYDAMREEKKKNDLDRLGFSAVGANIEEADLKAAQAERERDLKNFEAGPGKLAEQEYSERFNKRLAEEALKDEALYDKLSTGKEPAAPAEGTPEYAEVKGRLDSAKENYQRILNDKNSDPLAKKDALRRYLEVRNEFAKNDVPRYVAEMLDGLKEKTKRKEGVWEHMLGFSKKLGEMNLSKTNWEWVKKLEAWGKVPEKKLKLWGNKTLTIGGWSLGPRIVKAANMRTAVGGVLLGLSWPAAALAGVWGAAGALGLSAAFRGAGAMMGSYEAMRQGQQMLTNVSERDVAINFNDQEVVDASNSDLSVSRMSAAEVEEKLLGLIARARMNASWDQYKRPIELLAKRYQENLESAVAAGYSLEVAAKADLRTLEQKNTDPNKVNRTYEERREEVFGEKKQRALKEEAAMRGLAGAAGIAAAGSAIGFGRIGEYLKGLFGLGEKSAVIPPFEFPQDKQSYVEADWVRKTYGDTNEFPQDKISKREADWIRDQYGEPKTVKLRKMPEPKASDFSRAFSGEEISAKPWQSYQEFTNEPTPYREFDEEYYDPKLLGEDVEDQGLAESTEDKSDTSEQKKPDSVEPEKPPITKRQLIGYSGLRPEYYELVKEMSVEEYLEKKGMKFAFNQKDVFPIPNIDGEYPWQRQDRLAHNRWMDYDRLQERMRIAIGGMTPDARENALKGMTVEEFIKQYFAE